MTEKRTVYEMAKEYYPRLWDENRIKKLYEAGKLTEKEYNLIISESED